ncbi:iron-sulfur cluster assembly protein [Thermococcus sp. M36]|uniref:iron-sulfur cluster assembly protein n=1 Tax=Thermococcus sp. M36 TaxID=1638261 RepID=UPI001F0E766D|nr:iron-sulfur cluster assembly protein [Thermococcus sp. M36]
MRAEGVLELLRDVKNPFTGMSIVDEGLVTRVVVDGEKTVVYVAFARHTPPHPFAMALIWPLQAKIIREMVKVLGGRLGYFEIVDDMTLQRYYPVEEV